MYLKDVTPGQTIKVGNSVFTVATIRAGVASTTVETTGPYASMFSRPSLTTVVVL